MLNTIINKLGWIKKSTVEKTLFTLQNQLEDVNSENTSLWFELEHLKAGIEASKQAVKNTVKNTVKNPVKKVIVKTAKKTK